MCVCVCVCVERGERERDEVGEKKNSNILIESISLLAIILFFILFLIY